MTADSIECGFLKHEGLAAVSEKQGLHHSRRSSEVEAECGGAASLERSFSADFGAVYSGMAR